MADSGYSEATDARGTPEQVKDIATARKRLNIAIEATNQNRIYQVQDLRFLAGSPDNKFQWPEAVVALRENDPNGPRPCLTINKLPQHVLQVTNEQRQNRPSIKIIPVDNKGDVEVAEVLTGIVRHIEYASDADAAYSTGGDSQVAIGEGYVRVLSDYTDTRSFEQDLQILGVKNAFSVYMDPIGLQKDPTGAACEWCFIVEDLSEDEFERQYPEADPINWDLAGTGDEWKAWFPDSNTVRIAEYYCFRYEERTLQLWADGATTLEGDEQEAMRVTVGLAPIKTRKTTVRQLMWQKMNGCEIIDERELPGKYLPVVRMVGNEWYIDGRMVCAGLVRNAKDAQRMFNYWKHLSLDTPIPTPTGWTTMGEIKVGDQVIGADGKPCNVIGTSPVHVRKECYRITFCDGSQIVASDEHNWKVEERAGRNSSGLIWEEKVISTDKLKPGAHFIRSTRPIELAEADLPIHPYLLGLWLGDGHTAEPRITAGIMDVDGIRQNLIDIGCRLGSNSVQHGAACFTVLGERHKFTALGLLGNKHIPAQYLRSSRAQREALLQGLMDSDGSIGETKQCSFTTTNEAIARGFAELLRSLGIKAVSIARDRTLVVNGEARDCATAMQFSFSAGVGDAVFRLTRKKDRLCGNKHWRRTKRHGIKAVERVASVPVKCIGIDNESHLFLAGEAMIPTHNSTETETLALAPKAPFVGPAEAFEGHEDQWQQANTKNFAYLKYNGFNEAGERIDKPERQQPPMPPVGIVNAALGAADDIKSATGQYDPSLGNNPQAKSGVALQREQRKTDVGVFHYIDNQARAVRQVGRIIVDLIPKYYDTRRIARIIGEQQETDHVMIDPSMPQAIQKTKDETGIEQIAINPSIGKYDVIVSVGPSFTSKRQEAAQMMGEVLQGNPQLMGVIGDLYFKMLDVPGAEEIAKRLKKTLPPGLAEEEDGKEPEPMVATPQGPIPASAAGQLIAQQNEQLAQAAEQLKKAGDIEQAEAALKDQAHSIELAKKDVEALLKDLDCAKQELAHREQMAKEKIDNGERVVASIEGGRQDSAALAQNMQTLAEGLASAFNTLQEAIAAQGQMIEQVGQIAAAPRRNTMTVDGETFTSTSEIVRH